jgi:hypothetical protein
LIKAFSKFYIDGALFPAAALLLPWEKLPPAFVADRSDVRIQNSRIDDQNVDVDFLSI